MEKKQRSVFLEGKMLANDLLIGARAAGEYVGIGTKTIYNLTESGELPCKKLSGRLYFRKSELDRFFSAVAPAS